MVPVFTYMLGLLIGEKLAENPEVQAQLAAKALDFIHVALPLSIGLFGIVVVFSTVQMLARQ